MRRATTSNFTSRRGWKPSSQWREGILYPRWAEWANWGFGEPRFIFYPPASWMTGAAMGLVLPWRIVPGAFIWLALIAAGMAMWKLAREWLDGPQALVAAVLYAVNPYQLILVYYRSDFAELLAEALFPLLLWGAVRISRGEWRQVPWLAAIFAGIWISNAPAAVMATYSLALAIAVGCIVRRSFRPLDSRRDGHGGRLRPRGVLHFARSLGTALGADRAGGRR